MEKYTKTEFIDFLSTKNFNDSIIKRINNLPNTIRYKEHIYKINIETSWHREDNEYLEFELNYYCEEIMEFLLSYKIFKDVEISLNILEGELIEKGFIEK